MIYPLQGHVILLQKKSPRFILNGWIGEPHSDVKFVEKREIFADSPVVQNTA
jgi:hypothetical protein